MCGGHWLHWLWWSWCYSRLYQGISVDISYLSFHSYILIKFKTNTREFGDIMLRKLSSISRLCVVNIWNVLPTVTLSHLQHRILLTFKYRVQILYPRHLPIIKHIFTHHYPSLMMALTLINWLDDFFFLHRHQRLAVVSKLVWTRTYLSVYLCFS